MGGHAWVTLATNDSYSLGALVLAHSLKQVGTKQQLAVLITPGVTGSMRAKLSEVFNVVVEVNLLDSKDETNLRLLKRPELGVTFTKLHCWRLTQFDKCVFLDADTLVLENCDELFDREELSAAPDIGWPDCFNSGVFVFRPSMETHDKLIQFALEKGSFDGGDQGLLNLYFSDWAHKDISKHLPFIYNMASTACYSYLPAFKQFGKNAKIIHFIGASKPWLQYFDTESRKVHPSEGVKHLQEVLQLWWNIFCNLIHPKLSPEMTSHTDTVHGSQSSTYQSPSQTSPTPNASNPAEDYQKVWDPWEEYDARQQSNHSQIHHETPILDKYIPETPSQLSDNQHINSHMTQTLHPTENHNIQSHHNEHQNIQSHHNEHHNIQSHHGEHHHIQRPHGDHHNIQSHHGEHHNIHSHHHIENHHDEHHNIQSSPVEHDIHQTSHSEHNTFQLHAVQSHDIQSHSGQKEHIEPHNTNACIEADNHYHDHPNPVYSQPQTPVIVPSPEHIFSTKEPPPNDPPTPKLPDECMATTKVSNEMTIQTDSREDSNENNAGLAGAFAKLTLGSPRTAEQQALDDHLRRQGWEVGNIDYLGRDSFDNIWNKICQTLSSAPEQTAATKEPSPPTAESKSVEELPVEVISGEKSVEVASSEVQPVDPVPQAEPVKELPAAVTPEQVAQPIETPAAETPQTLECTRTTITRQIEPIEAIELVDPIESKTEAVEATEVIPAPVSEAIKVSKLPETPPIQTQQVETPTPVALTSEIPVPSEPVLTQPAPVECPVAPVPEPVPVKPILEPVTDPSTTKTPVASVPESTQVAPVQPSTPKLDTQPPVERLTPPTPEATVPEASQPAPKEPPIPKSKIEPVAPVATQPISSKPVPEPQPSSEQPKQTPAKKPFEKLDVAAVPAALEQPAAPKVPSAPVQAQVTEPSPPTSPESPQPEQVKVAKEALKVEATVPATPPPDAQQTSSGPTPPPRKSSGGTKKATKPKK